MADDARVVLYRVAREPDDHLSPQSKKPAHAGPVERHKIPEDGPERGHGSQNSDLLVIPPGQLLDWGAPDGAT